MKFLPSKLFGFKAAAKPLTENSLLLGFWGAIRDCSSTYVFFLVADPVFFSVIAYETASFLLPSDPFVGLHCEHRPAPTVVRDFEQRTMSTSVNGASDALGMGPSAGYSLIFLITVICAFTVCHLCML